MSAPGYLVTQYLSLEELDARAFIEAASIFGFVRTHIGGACTPMRRPFGDPWPEGRETPVDLRSRCDYCGLRVQASGWKCASCGAPK